MPITETDRACERDQLSMLKGRSMFQGFDHDGRVYVSGWFTDLRSALDHWAECGIDLFPIAEIRCDHEVVA